MLETDSLNQPTVSYVLGGMQVLSQTKNATTTYLLPDCQGSTRLLTNANGGAVASQAFEYTAFGDLLSTNTPDTSYLYTGQQYDAATDLYSLRARYYDPGVGRFLSRDTWAYNFQNPVELNRYGYVENNPIGYVDPSGHEGIPGYIRNLVKNTWKAARSLSDFHSTFIEGAVSGVVGYIAGFIVAKALRAAYEERPLTWEDLNLSPFDAIMNGMLGGILNVYAELTKQRVAEIGRMDPSMTEEASRHFRMVENYFSGLFLNRIQDR